MSKKKRILLIVLLVLVVAVACLVLWQWNNITALIHSIRYEQEDLEAEMVENEQQIQETLDLYPELQVQPLDDETKEKLVSGELTEEEVIEILTRPTVGTVPNGGKDQPSNQNQGKPENPQGTKPKTSVEAANEEIARLVARVYVLQAEFVAKLGAIEGKARAEIAKLPKEEQTYDRKIAIGKSYVGEMTALEAQCDGEISAIVAKVRKLLSDSGQPTTLADTIKSTYEREKSLKKAYYVNRYL